jgi:hypothetical protein
LGSKEWILPISRMGVNQWRVKPEANREERRGQRSEVRGQRSAVSGQRSGGRGRGTGDGGSGCLHGRDIYVRTVYHPEIGGRFKCFWPPLCGWYGVGQVLACLLAGEALTVDGPPGVVGQAGRRGACGRASRIRGRVRYGGVDVAGFGDELPRSTADAGTTDGAVGGQRTEDRGQRAEGRGQKSEVRSQKSEVRSQKSGDRSQGTGVRGQGSGDRGCHEMAG